MKRTDLDLVVAKQLPEYIREDYPTFVAFVEAYYSFLKDQNVDLTQIRDIDITLQEFISQFKKELAHNFPVDAQNERFLLQRIKDQYLAKGSEASYKLLFRLLFGKNVELSYPGRSMLRASDGRWNQEVSVFVQVEYGDPDEVVGKNVDIQTTNRVLNVLVDKKQDIVGDPGAIASLGGNVYELFLDRTTIGEFAAGNIIRYKDTFKAIILPCIAKINIEQPGTNFRVGQVFEIQLGNGTAALMKVTRVTETGGLKSVELISFGVGYIEGFTLSVLSQNSVTSGLSAGSSANNQPALIRVNLGAIARYPGYFQTNNGFLSDSIFIQDSKYYQAFSYVIKIDQRLQEYASAVKTIVHPAGMAMFGEYTIVNDIDLAIFLESAIKSLGVTIRDSLEPSESLTLNITKAIVDTVGSSEQVLIVFSKPLQTSLSTPQDALTKSFGKSLSSNATPGDATAVKSFSKSLSTSNSVTDSGPTKGVSKSLVTSLPQQTETVATRVNKYLQTTTVGTWSNDGAIWKNPYQAEDWFNYAEQYSEGLQTFTN